LLEIPAPPFSGLDIIAQAQCLIGLAGPIVAVFCIGPLNQRQPLVPPHPSALFAAETYVLSSPNWGLASDHRLLVAGFTAEHKSSLENK
jgi:hypothetical protein